MNDNNRASKVVMKNLDKADREEFKRRCDENKLVKVMSNSDGSVYELPNRSFKAWEKSVRHA